MSIIYDPIRDNGKQIPGLFGNGLDESDVLLFVNSLIEQNSELACKLEQVESFIELVMGGVQDASQQTESARAKADKIIVEARKTAESNASEKISSAEQQARAMLRAAQEKAQSIIRTAEDEASRIINEAKQKAESAKWQAKEIIATAEAKAREIKGQAEGEASKIALEAKTKAEKEALLIKQEAEQVLEKNKAIDNKGELKETLTAILTHLKGNDGQKSAQASAQEEADKKEQLVLYSGTVELEVPPPISMNPLRDLARYLKNTRQIEVLGLNSTSNHGLKIKLFLHKPLPLIHIIKSMPEVEKVSADSRKNQGAQSSRKQTGDGSILVKMRS